MIPWRPCACTISKIDVLAELQVHGESLELSGRYLPCLACQQINQLPCHTSHLAFADHPTFQPAPRSSPQCTSSSASEPLNLISIDRPSADPIFSMPVTQKGGAGTLDQLQCTTNRSSLDHMTVPVALWSSWVPVTRRPTTENQS